MTDHQQKPVNRSMTPKTPTAVPFKKGDIIWVVYRKHINWPAKVTAYYPKERKVSYVFFPLVPKNNVFKADPAKVQLFTLDDQLPENAKPDLEECFEQARRVLQGVPEEEIIAENAQKAEETPVQAKPKKKALTTADALKKSVATPKSTPKRQPKAAILAEKAVNFTQGDPIIVDTPMGMWPGMFISLAKGDSQKVNYSLFPREEHSHEVLLTTIASIIPFPPEQIEQALEDGRESNSQVLLAAMLDLQKYLKERGHSTDTTSSSSSADVSQTPLSSGSSMMLNESSVKEKKSKKPVKMELTPPKESNKAQPRKSLNSRLSNRGGDEENVTTAPAAMKSKKRAASQMLQEEEEEEAVNDEPPAEPMVKRRKELGMDTDDETANEEEEEEEEEDAKALSLSPPTTAAATASHKNSPIHQLMNGEGGSAAEGKPRRLSEAERNQELAHLGEKVEKVMREKQQKAMKDRDQQQQQTTSSSSLSPSPAKESAMAKKVAADAAIPTVSVTESANKGVSAYEMAVSNECQTHIEGVLSKFGEEWFLEQLGSDENFCLEFQKVGMFTRKELADLVSVVQKWVETVFYEESCPDERFSQLCELSLISKHVMPEIGAFVIAAQNNCSLEEAKRIYAEKCASALVSAADPPTASPKQQQVHKQNNNNTTTNNKSISTLIEAAKMMEGGASSEEQHQNGVSVPNSPGEGSSAMPLVTNNNNNSLTIQADTDSAGDSE